MFTFGREHEKNCAVEYLHHKEQTPIVHALIDGIHDFLEEKITESELRKCISDAFVMGGAGCWEQTGTWLRKLGKEYPGLQSLWTEFANSLDSTVRYRAACCLDDMPPEVASEIKVKLVADLNEKVREMAVSRTTSEQPG